MSNWGDAIGGVKTVVEANTSPTVRVYTYPTDAVQQVPSVVVLPERMDPTLALGGNSFEATLRLVCLVYAGDDQHAFEALYDHLDPTAADKSIIKALRTDPTLDGKVDDSEIEGIENIGRRDLGQGKFFVGFDLLLKFVKSVA